MWRSHVSAAVVVVLAYLVAVLTMEVYDEECNEGSAAEDNDDNDNDRQGNGSKSFGVEGGGRDNKDGQRRRMEEAC